MTEPLPAGSSPSGPFRGALASAEEVPTLDSAGVKGAAIALFVQGAIIGVAGGVAAVVALGMTLDLLVGIVWSLVRTVGVDAATPDLFPDLAIANLDTYLLLVVVAAALLLLSRREITLGRALLDGDPEAVPSAVGLQWWFLGIGALFAFWTPVITKDAVLFPIVAIVLPLVALALFAIGGQRPFPRASGGGSSFSGTSTERWNWRSGTERREALLAVVFLWGAIDLATGWQGLDAMPGALRAVLAAVFTVLCVRMARRAINVSRGNGRDKLGPDIERIDS